MWCSIPHVGTYRLLVCWLPINLLEVWCDGLCCACAAVVVYFPTWFLDLFIEVICILVIYILVIFLFLFIFLFFYFIQLYIEAYPYPMPTTYTHENGCMRGVRYGTDICIC